MFSGGASYNHSQFCLDKAKSRSCHVWFENQDFASLSGQVKWNLSLCRSAPLGLLTSADYSKIQVFSYLFFAFKKASITSALLPFICASPSALWSHSPLLLGQSELHAIKHQFRTADGFY